VSIRLAFGLAPSVSPGSVKCRSPPSAHEWAGGTLAGARLSEPDFIGESRAFIVNFITFLVWGLGLGLVLVPPFITLPVLMVLFAALMAAPFYREYLAGKWKWLVLPFVIWPLIVAYGVLFQWQEEVPPPAWHALGLDLLMLLHLPAALACLFIARRCPLVPLGLSIFQAWLSLGGFAIASMSVKNMWL
jgi:hypothetical protein